MYLKGWLAIRWKNGTERKKPYQSQSLGPAAKSTLQIPNLDSNKQQNQTDQETTKKRACWGLDARKYLLFPTPAKEKTLAMSTCRWSDVQILTGEWKNYESQRQIVQLEIPLVERTLGRNKELPTKYQRQTAQSIIEFFEGKFHSKRQSTFKIS